MSGRWDADCAAILRRMSGQYHDHEVAAWIEARTGKRFTPKTVQRYRLAAGLDACHRNDWTAPVRRYKTCSRNPLTSSVPIGAYA